MSPSPIKQKYQCQALVKQPRWMNTRCKNGAQEGKNWCGVHIKTQGTVDPQTQFKGDEDFHPNPKKADVYYELLHYLYHNMNDEQLDKIDEQLRSEMKI